MKSRLALKLKLTDVDTRGRTVVVTAANQNGLVFFWSVAFKEAAARTRGGAAASFRHS